jgi:hypothetical protein
MLRDGEDRRRCGWWRLYCLPRVVHVGWFLDIHLPTCFHSYGLGPQGANSRAAGDDRSTHSRSNDQAGGPSIIESTKQRMPSTRTAYSYKYKCVSFNCAKANDSLVHRALLHGLTLHHVPLWPAHALVAIHARAHELAVRIRPGRLRKAPDRLERVYLHLVDVLCAV